MLIAGRQCRTPRQERVRLWIGITLAVVVMTAAPARASGIRAQDAPLPPEQQAQTKVQEDWPEQAGICRRTLPGCEGRSTTAIRLEPDEGVEPDGTLDEAVWRRTPWVTDFVQVEPVEGARPSVRTEVAFAYDDETLYVAARNYDPDPERIRGNLARRDATDGLIA